MVRLRHVCALALTGSAGLAQTNLFVITATGGGEERTVGANSLLDLVEAAVETRDEFAAFENVDATFRLNYGGIADAITVTKNAGNTDATLTFGPTGVSRTFTAANEDELEDQIEEYLKRNGDGDVADFLREVNARTPIAVSDGNPNATTARMADLAFQRFGLFSDEFKAFTLRSAPVQPAEPEGGPAQEDPPEEESSPVMTTRRRRADFQLWAGAWASVFEAGDFEGESATVALGGAGNFTERVGLSLSGAFSYNTVEDADVFHGYGVLGVPVRVVLPDADTQFTWQLTPFFAAGGSGSEDIGAGGLIFGGGGASYLAWHVSDRWTLALANQIAFFEGETLEFDDFEIDPGVSQSILKNGIKATARLTESMFAFGGLSYTNMLEDAAVDGWATPAAGVGWSSKAGSTFSAGVQGDFGDDYNAFGLRLAFNLMF
ncbi:MAG TPA: hypothetical protein VD971_12015 [Phycisphaerales bacterium]|nr:hypothetical protein [Phycisphaerales bacterium]